MASAPIEHDPSLDIKLLTLTRLWLFDKKIYNVGAKALLVPVSIRTVLYGACVLIPFGAILTLFGMPWSGSFSMFIRFFVPGLIVWLALRYVSAGGKAWELLGAWVFYGFAVARHALRGTGDCGVRFGRRVQVARRPG